MEQPSEYMSAREAREYLGINKVKMADLIARKILPAIPDPFDKRVKLVRRADVDALKRMQRPKTLAA